MTLGSNGAYSLPAMRLARAVGTVVSSPASRFRYKILSCYRFHSCLSRMSGRTQVWHMSHGIVFAGNREVVYPQLPVMRLHSSVTVSEKGGKTAISSALNADVDQDSSAEGLVSAAHDAGRRLQDEAGNAVEAAEGAELSGTASDEPVTIDKSVSQDFNVPFTSLDFRIPPEVFREAKLAKLGTPESFWSYGLYRGRGEGGSPSTKVKVHYCKSKHTTERVLQQYFMDEKVLGFDLEWWPSATRSHGPRQNVSLVQLASQSRIALFHLALYPKGDLLVAPSLKEIMEDPNVTKVGVAIKGDCTRLRNFLKINSRGTFELSHLYKLVKHSSTGSFRYVNKRLVSLATQVQEYLRLPLFKGPDVRSSDWTQPLQMDQIIYSASDAYAALQLYYTLDHERQNLDPVPPLPHHAELNLPIRLADGITITTSEESLEAIEGEDESNDGPRLSARYLKSLGDSINIEPEPENSEPILKETPRPRRTPSTQQVPKDARIVEAETWSVKYRETNFVSVGAASLRAYRIWHSNPDLDPQAIAKLLRQPPLQTATVVNYVLEAIRLENLPYDAVRLQTQLLDAVPADIRARRYKSLVKKCQAALVAQTQPAVESG